MGKQSAVFIPGLLCTAALFAPQVKGLADIADIAIGDHTRHDLVGDAAQAILDDAPDRFALAGLSMGCYIAFEIMRREPQRVTKLALMDSSARPDTIEQSGRRRALMAEAERNGLTGVVDVLLPLFVHKDRLTDTQLTSLVHDMAEETGVTAFIRQQRAIMSRPDSRPGLAAISCPVTVIVGDGDILTPPDLAREMADGIGSARLEIIEGAGHLSTLEKPDAVTAVLRAWL